MATQYAPLVFPQNLGATPLDYQTKIPLFENTETITAQQHVDKMNDFFDLHEVEIEDAMLRLFVQSFGGEVQKWFRALPTSFIPTLPVL